MPFKYHIQIEAQIGTKNSTLILNCTKVFLKPQMTSDATALPEGD
jgi:hypothetical protein